MPIAVFPAPTTPWTTVRKLVDETVTSTTTVQDDDALTFALAANTRYVFRAFVRFASPATADFKYAIVCTGTQNSGVGSPTGFSALHFFDNTIADENAASCPTPVDVTIAFTSGAGGAVRLTGTIAQTGTAGTWTFRFAQVTSDPGATTVLAGSYVEWMVGQ